jgi:hypothetical protein
MNSQKVVIPAQVEIQDRGKALKNWIPVFTGMTEKRRERLFKRHHHSFCPILRQRRNFHGSQRSLSW